MAIDINKGAIQLVGIDRTLTHVRQLAKEDKKALRAGMGKAGRFLLARSKALTPVSTGRLHASGKSRVLNNSESNPEYIVSFDTDYAVHVHENLDAFHPVGQAKFLEEPAREYRLTLLHIIRSEVRLKKIGRVKKRGRK